MFLAFLKDVRGKLFPTCREVDSAGDNGYTRLIVSRSEDTDVPVGTPHGESGKEADERFVEVGTVVGNDDGNEVLERGEESGQAVVRVDEVGLKGADCLPEGTEVAQVPEGSLAYYGEEVYLASQEAQSVGLLQDEWGKTTGVM